MRAGFHDENKVSMSRLKSHYIHNLYTKGSPRVAKRKKQGDSIVRILEGYGEPMTAKAIYECLPEMLRPKTSRAMAQIFRFDSKKRIVKCAEHRGRGLYGLREWGL